MVNFKKIRWKLSGSILFVIVPLIAVQMFMFLQSTDFLQKSQEKGQDAVTEIQGHLVDTLLTYEFALSVPFFELVVEEDTGELNDQVNDHFSSGQVSGFVFLNADEEVVLARTIEGFPDVKLFEDLTAITNENKEKLNTMAIDDPISQILTNKKDSYIAVVRRFGQTDSPEGFMVTLFDLKKFLEIENTLIESSTQFMNQSKTALAYAITGALGFVFILGFIAIRFLERNFSSPITTLMKSAEAVASGDYELQAPINSEDELGKLTEEFNKMTRSLDATWKENQEYRTSLEHKVEERTKEVEAAREKIQRILDHIEQGIITFDSEFKISPEFSRYTEVIFETNSEAIAKSDIFDLVLNQSDLDEENIDQTRQLLNCCLGEDSLAWDLNGEQLTKDLNINTENGLKILSVDWTPMYNKDDICTTVMLSVKDMTKQRALEAAIEQEKEANEKRTKIIQQILSVPRSNFQRFIAETRQRFEVIADLLTQDPLNLGKIKIELHTLKGMARLIGVKDLSSAIHGAESLISNIPNTPSAEDVNDILEPAISIQNDYNTIHDELFSFMNKPEDTNLFSCVSDFLPQAVKQVTDAGLELDAVTVIDKIQGWRQENLSQLNQIMVHSLTNAIDHGYIRPKREKGISEKVKIEVEGHRNERGIEITITDYGQGLNMNKLEQIAKDKQFVPEPGQTMAVHLLRSSQ